MWVHPVKPVDLWSLSQTINSLVNTITEFAGIDYVKMTVAGVPMNIEHAILEDPLPRNEDMIER